MRALLLIPAIAILTMLTVASGPAVAEVGPEDGTIVTVKLELPESNGLEAQLEADDEGMVTLEVGRIDTPDVAGRAVVYKAKGRVSETGLKVQFGRLGLIDVAFSPTETLGSTEPSAGCTGAPRTWRRGVFTGTIDFTGEREYVHIQTSQVEGTMNVISAWQCPEEPILFKDALPSAASSKNPKKKVSATLYAGGRRCDCTFAAGVHFPKGRGESLFYGVRNESREKMEIGRVIVARGSGSAFVYDHAAGTATLRPPPPFIGRATFKGRAYPGGDPGDGWVSTLWRSTIRMPFLGIDPLYPRPGAIIIPEYHFDSE